MSSEWQTKLAYIPPTFIGPPNPNDKEGTQQLEFPTHISLRRIGKQSWRACLKKKMLTRRKKYKQLYLYCDIW
jgi:hypothetical protein